LALSQAESRLNAEVEGTNDKLTAQQKTLATQSLIMNATKDAQGDFAKTSDGLANSQRILTAQMKDLQANMGKILLPIVESAVAFFSDFTGVLAGNQKVMVVVIGVVAALATAIIAANVAMKIYTATTKAAAAAQALFNFIMSANPIALVIIAVAAFVAALIVLEKRFGIISKGFELFSEGFYRFIINPIKQAIGFISDLIGAFKRIPGVGAIGGFLGGINIPGFADGGIVTKPTLAMVGEKGPEAIVPLGRGGGVGGVTVNVTGGLATSAEIGQAVVNAIRAYNRSAGPAQIQVA
jgi:SLT domain-containing protein